MKTGTQEGTQFRLSDVERQSLAEASVTRRRVLRGVFASGVGGAGVLTLAACGAGGAGGAQGQEAQVGTAGKREVTLRFIMHNDNSEIPTFTGIGEMFTQRFAKITVQPEPIAWDDYSTKITAMLAGGTAPDCCYQASRRVIGFAANGQTVDLNTLVKKDKEAKKEAFWQGTLDENTWRGVLFGWPSDAVGVPIAFNRSLIQQHGGKLPSQYVAEKKWNWDAVLEIGKRVSGHEETWGVSVRNWDGDWPNWIYQNGGEVLNKDRTEVLLNRPEAYEAIQFSVDLMYRHKIAPAFNKNPWTDGKLALTLAHPNSVQSWRKTANFEWDIAPLWTKKGAGSTLFTGATTLFKDSKNVDEAWAFAKFFGGREAEIERINKNGRTPAMKALQEEYVKILDPKQPPANAKYYIDALEYSRPLPITPVWTEMRQIIGEELKPVWDGEKPAKDATAEIARRINPLLAQFKK